MKIIEFCPFFNENKIAEIKIRENAYWIDELHLCEANKNFSCEDKVYNFNQTLLTSKVKYHPIDANPIFRMPVKEQSYFNLETCTAENFDSWYWELLCNNSGFYNEAVQRNYCSTLKDTVADDDIIILSDVDEILDSRNADRIIHEVKKHNIISVKLHFSVFYLNLFCTKNHGAKDFSYRVYIMTGKYFKAMPVTSDYIRKKGIAEGLINTIYCIPEFMGFHHSWMEFSNNAYDKLKAFEANVKDKTLIRKSFADDCVQEKRLTYLDADLYVDNEKQFLRAITQLDTEGLWYNSN